MHAKGLKHLESAEDKAQVKVVYDGTDEYQFVCIEADEGKGSFVADQTSFQTALFFVARGSLLVQQRENYWTLSPSIGLVLDPTTPFALTFKQSSSVYIFLVCDEQLRYHTAYKPDQLVHLKLSMRSSIGSICSSAAKSIARNCAGLHRLELNSMGCGLLQICSVLISSERRKLKGITSSMTQQEVLRQKVDSYLMRNLKDSDVNLEQLASELGVSSRYISKAYSVTGNTVMARLKELRLSYAAQKLLEHRYRNTPIAQIALDCGFKSVEHFCRAFKETYKLSPAKYRSVNSALP